MGTTFRRSNFFFLFIATCFFMVVGCIGGKQTEQEAALIICRDSALAVKDLTGSYRQTKRAEYIAEHVTNKTILDRFRVVATNSDPSAKTKFLNEMAKLAGLEKCET